MRRVLKFLVFWLARTYSDGEYSWRVQGRPLWPDGWWWHGICSQDSAVHAHQEFWRLHDRSHSGHYSFLLSPFVVDSSVVLGTSLHIISFNPFCLSVCLFVCLHTFLFSYRLQLVNKFNYLPFTKNDENFVEAFSIFCGMGISNTNM